MCRYCTFQNKILSFSQFEGSSFLKLLTHRNNDEDAIYFMATHWQIYGCSRNRYDVNYALNLYLRIYCNKRDSILIQFSMIIDKFKESMYSYDLFILSGCIKTEIYFLGTEKWNGISLATCTAKWRDNQFLEILTPVQVMHKIIQHASILYHHVSPQHFCIDIEKAGLLEIHIWITPILLTIQE